MTAAHRVLICDDDPAVRRSLARVLRASGYVTIEAEDGVTGLELFVKQPVSFLVVDVRMPCMAGTTLVRKIRSLGYATPVLLITGFATPPDARSVTELPAVALLDKPVDTADLLARVDAECGAEGAGPAPASPPSQPSWWLDAEDRHKLERSVAFINDTTVRAGLDLARVIGEHIIAEFFGGDYRRFADPNGYKPVSFRALMRREDLLVRPKTLYRFVRISQQLKELPGDVSAQLSLGHHRLLLPVPGEHKQRLATAAAHNRWSCRELSEEIRASVPRRPRGRPPLPGPVKALRAAAKAFRDLSVDELEGLQQLDADKLASLMENAQQLQERLEQVRRALAVATNRRERKASRASGAAALGQGK